MVFNQKDRDIDVEIATTDFKTENERKMF